MVTISTTCLLDFLDFFLYGVFMVFRSGLEINSDFYAKER
jgi:hypothetical protein